MDELTLLRSLRDDIAKPDAERLAPAFAKLENAMHEATPKRADRPRRRRHPIRWAAAGLSIAAAAAAAIVVGGVLAPPHPAAASAATVLRQAAAEAITYSDPVVGPGQYLKFHIKADWASFRVGADGSTARDPQNIQNIDIYVPADRNADWVLYRDYAHGITGDGEFQAETTRLPGGVMENGRPYLDIDLSRIPTGSGAETLAYFDSSYGGGSSNRDEDNFVRITDILRYYPVPAELRARMFEALALIPGTTSINGVANLEGKVGVAIGRSEPARGDQRQEIIIDPATGQVIGDRVAFPVGAASAGQEPWSFTAMSTTVVDSAP